MKLLIDDRFTDEARRLLEVGRYHPRCVNRDNPVTGTTFAYGLDPIVWQIRDAARALRARDRFARENPDLPPLPLRPAEWERPKAPPTVGRIEHALAMFGRSLAGDNRYDLDRHPSFDNYIRGFLCSLRLREMFAPIADRFPPKPLPGLVPGYSYWGSPGRLGYLDELILADETGMPEWPTGWLLPKQQIFAAGVKDGATMRRMKETTNG